MKVGTGYGGWIVPANISLGEGSVMYSAGVGEDMSFDVLMQSRYGCSIVLIDPTAKAVRHFDECRRHFSDGSAFTGCIQKDYLSCIRDARPDFSKFAYVNKGLWSSRDTLRFYRQDNPEYVSQSLIDGMFTADYDEIPVDSLKNIMAAQGHDHIDLLKMDIEGAENAVLNQMLDDGIFPTYLCVEFDLLIKRKDPGGATQQVVNRLVENGYRMLANDQFNITFERTV